MRVLLFMILMALASMFCQAVLPDAHAWEVVDDHQAHTLRFEALPTVPQLAKKQLCTSLIGVEDCFPHLSLESGGGKELRARARWKF
jgi:hypothetical protein